MECGKGEISDKAEKEEKEEKEVKDVDTGSAAGLPAAGLLAGLKRLPPMSRLPVPNGLHPAITPPSAVGEGEEGVSSDCGRRDWMGVA